MVIRGLPLSFVIALRNQKPDALVLRASLGDLGHPHPPMECMLTRNSIERSAKLHAHGNTVKFCQVLGFQHTVLTVTLRASMV